MVTSVNNPYNGDRLQVLEENAGNSNSKTTILKKNEQYGTDVSSLVRETNRNLSDNLLYLYHRRRNLLLEKIKIMVESLLSDIASIDKNIIPESRKQIVIDDICSVIEKERLRLPEVAPEYYANRKDKAERIDKFLERIWYRPWIEEGVLTRPDLRRIDPYAEIALRNWLREPKTESGVSVERNSLPDYMHIPTKSEALSKWVDGRSREEIKEAQRLSRQASRRNITER